MKSINTDLVLIINSEKPGEQKSINYLRSIPGVHLTIVDLATERLKEVELISLAGKMNLPVEDLLDPDFDDHISVHTEGLKLMDRQSLISLMCEDTKLIATPIVLMGEQAFMLGKTGEGVKHNQAFEMASRFFSTGPGTSVY